VLRVSAAYFAGISTEGYKTQRYITFAGLAVKDPMPQSSPSVQNTIEEIPVFTDLDIKDLTNVMVLPKWNYGIARSRPYRTRSRIANSLVNERGREELLYVLNI